MCVCVGAIDVYLCGRNVSCQTDGAAELFVAVEPMPASDGDATSRGVSSSCVPLSSAPAPRRGARLRDSPRSMGSADLSALALDDECSVPFELSASVLPAHVERVDAPGVVALTAADVVDGSSSVPTRFAAVEPHDHDRTAAAMTGIAQRRSLRRQDLRGVPCDAAVLPLTERFRAWDPPV